MTTRRVRPLGTGLIPSTLAGVAMLAAASVAWAGGSAENMLLIIDPSNKDSQYIGNYYKNARNIPSSNVLYMAPGASNYATFVNNNLDALFGFLANAAISDHIDYIVLMPGSPFYVPASGYVTDSCYAVNRFSISGAYTMAYITADILPGGVPSTTVNRYYSGTDEARAFDSSVLYRLGAPSTNAAARRYFIGAMLGYSGSLGSTLAETLAMIDRSVAADGTRPAGTFYFMRTTDTARSGPRDPYFDATVASIVALGGQAVDPNGILPNGQDDCLGIMTGWASFDIPGANLTILPGAFCDHLTSWAATFDISSQTKVSAWIANGASGTWGTVEEPCNYPGKFPHPRVHLYYYAGLSLGEAAFRSVGYAPFQGLLYGDPMSRPFAYLPDVAVNDAPTAPVAATITLTPTATTAHPSAAIAQFDLLIDGVLYASTPPGGNFAVGTTQLTDGWHDLRVLAYDDTLVKSTGRWTGSMTVVNRGRTVTISPTLLSGNWTTPFVFDVATTGGSPHEVRVMQNGRIVAAAPGSSATLTVHGLTLGAGPVEVQGEAVFNDGRAVRSAPITISVTPTTGTPTGQPPVAYGFTKRVLDDQSFVVELPATFDNPAGTLTYQLLSGPTQATVPAGQTGAYQLMRPVAGAKGLDAFTFRVTSPAGDSNVATVALDYGVRRGDVNCDGIVSYADINPFVQVLSSQSAWQAAYPDCPIENADINWDGVVSFADINPFVALISGI